VPAVGNLRRYGQIVKEMSLLRRVLTATYEIQASVHNHDALPKEIVERAERTMLEVAHDDSTKDFRDVGAVLEAEIDVWQTLSTEGVQLTGTASGFNDLDEITGGFQPGNLIIVAARPSMGKSALVTNVAENVSLHPDRPRPVALFSLEMSESELAQRFIASNAGIKGDDLRKGRLRDERKWKRVLEAASRYSSAPLFIDDSSDISILEIRAKARRLHQQMLAEYGGLGLIIVDYLQLMRPDGRRTAGWSRSGRCREGSRSWPASSRSRSSRCRSSRAAWSPGRTSARSSRICASRARSSRTPTSWSSSTATSTTTPRPRTGPARRSSSSPSTATARSATCRSSSRVSSRGSAG
jgi:replicative DNA helicase